MVDRVVELDLHLCIVHKEPSVESLQHTFREAHINGHTFKCDSARIVDPKESILLNSEVW